MAHDILPKNHFGHVSSQTKKKTHFNRFICAGAMVPQTCVCHIQSQTRETYITLLFWRRALKKITCIKLPINDLSNHRQTVVSR